MKKYKSIYCLSLFFMFLFVNITNASSNESDLSNDIIELQTESFSEVNAESYIEENVDEDTNLEETNEEDTASSNLELIQPDEIEFEIEYNKQLETQIYVENKAYTDTEKKENIDLLESNKNENIKESEIIDVEEVSGYLRVTTNVRTSPNGELVSTLRKNTFIQGHKIGDWILLEDGNYVYNFGLEMLPQVQGYLLQSTNVRSSKTGPIVNKYYVGDYVSGRLDGNWIIMEDGNYIYNFGLSQDPMLEGYLYKTTNVRTSPNGEIISVYTAGTKVTGFAQGDYILLNNGLYVYNFGLSHTPMIKGYLYRTTNVRTSPTGNIVDVYPVGTEISGFAVDEYIRLENGYYLYNFGITQGQRVVGYLNTDVNVRDLPNGKLIGRLEIGTKVSGFIEGDYIRLDNATFVYNFGLVENFKDVDFPLEYGSEVEGHTTTIVNVRTSPDGLLVGTISSGKYVEGIAEGKWIKLENGTYIHASYVDTDIRISGYLPEKVNVRTSPTGPVINTLDAGIYIEGDRFENWIILDELDYYVWNFGLEEEKTNFILALDPGHGAGYKHNRGGVLFNEGDQNYKFTQLIAAEARRYKNVSVAISRLQITDDPSISERRDLGKNSDVYLSIHTNASGTGDSYTRGVEVYGSIENENNNIGRNITTSVASMLNTPNRGLKFRDYYSYISYYDKSQVTRDYYGVVRDNESSEKYLVETVFHTNYTDSMRYLNNQQRLAQEFMKIIAREHNLVLK